MNANHEKALRLQKKIFQSLKQEASLLLGKMPETILRYEKENQRDFKGSYRRVQKISKSDLLKEIKKADVTFIADFHSFDQAQRTALRIMREAVDQQTEWLVGLEMIPSQFQNALDDFQSGQISLQEFHDTISYREEWGFPWKNYAPIFEWAKENCVRLIALNRPKVLFQMKDDQELHERDQWAAGIITDLFAEPQSKGRKAKKRKMLILYGELHVGSLHLPLQLKKRSKEFLKKALHCITIHQNEDRLFWTLADRGHELQTESLKLKRNVFCLLSSTPWAKFQSLVNWAESHSMDSIEGEIDHLSMIRSYGDTLAEFLNLASPPYETLSICTIDQVHLLTQLDQDSRLSSIDRKIIQFNIRYNHRFYVPQISIVYLGTSSSPNIIAEFAAIHLLKSAQKPANLNLFELSREGFFKFILESAFGFFGSLIIHPKRKCDLLNDHIQRLEDLNANKNQNLPLIQRIFPKDFTSKEMFPGEAQARQLTLDLLRSPNQSLPKEKGFRSFDKNLSFKKNQINTLLVTAKYTGSILGKNLHQLFINGKISTDWIRPLFLNSPEWDPRFYEKKFDEFVSKIPSEFLNISKRDHF